MTFSYWFKNWSLNYKIGYGIVRLGNRTFYKKFEVAGLNKIPENAGVLFAINHQNAFMDPVVLSSQLNKNAYYLARADIFKKKLANKILRSIYMLPIYRQRDGVNTIVKNEDTFNECYDVLENNGCVLIFPEGNHNNQKKLRPLKKGIARIGLGAAKKYGFSKPYYIIPVGLDYSNHTNMGANLFINISDPINLEAYYPSFEKDPNSTINHLMDEIKLKLESLVLNIQSENYSTYTNIIWLLEQDMSKNSTLKENLASQQNLVSKLEKLETVSNKSFLTIESLSKAIFNYLKSNQLKPTHLYGKNSLAVAIFKSLALLFLFPFHLVGLVSNYIPYKLPVILVEKKIKDPHFHSSIKMSMGVILFIVFWSIQTIVVTLILGWKIGILYLLSLPILAMLNYRWFIQLKKTKGLIRSLQLQNTSDFKNAVSEFNEFIQKINSLETT